MLAFLKACVVRRSKDNSVQKDNIRIVENEQSQGIKEVVKWLEASYTQMCVVLHNTNICMHTILQKGVFSVENVDVFYHFEDGRAFFGTKKDTRPEMNLPNTTFLAYTQDTYDITKQQGNLKRSITYDVLKEHIWRI